MHAVLTWRGTHPDDASSSSLSSPPALHAGVTPRLAAASSATMVRPMRQMVFRFSDSALSLTLHYAMTSTGSTMGAVKAQNAATFSTCHRIASQQHVAALQGAAAQMRTRMTTMGVGVTTTTVAYRLRERRSQS